MTMNSGKLWKIPTIKKQDKKRGPPNFSRNVPNCTWPCRKSSKILDCWDSCRWMLPMRKVWDGSWHGLTKRMDMSLRPTLNGPARPRTCFNVPFKRKTPFTKVWRTFKNASINDVLPYNDSSNNNNNRQHRMSIENDKDDSRIGCRKLVRNLSTNDRTVLGIRYGLSPPFCRYTCPHCFIESQAFCVFWKHGIYIIHFCERRISWNKCTRNTNVRTCNESCRHGTTCFV